MEKLVVEKKLRRRAYMRNMMKIYRDEFKLEMAYLKDKEIKLEEELRTILLAKNSHDSVWSLPWKDVAHALKNSYSESSMEHDVLKEQVNEIQSIMYDMQRWVSIQMKIPKTPRNQVTTWRHTSLLGNPSSRRLGKVWITQQMNQNAERMFEEFHFPTINEKFDLYDFEVIQSSSGTFEYIHRRQFDVNLPSDLIMGMYRDIISSLLVVDDFRRVNVLTPLEVCDNTTMHTIPTRTWHKELVHLLTGEFHNTPQQSIFVAQQIQDDEILSYPVPTQRNRSVWTQVHAISPTISRVRTLYIHSQLTTKDGTALPFEEEAISWEFNPSQYPDRLHFEKFRQHVIERAGKLLSTAKERVQEYVNENQFFHSKR